MAWMWYSKDFSWQASFFFFFFTLAWYSLTLPLANNDVKTPHDVKMGSRSKDRCRHFGVTCLLLIFGGWWEFDTVIYSANLDGSFLSLAVSVAESCLLSCCPRHHDSTRGCDFAEPNMSKLNYTDGEFLLSGPHLSHQYATLSFSPSY